MRRYEQMEQRRFEQQVAPNIDQTAPAPVRGPVRITPPNTRLPDLSMIQTALQDGARLAVQLAGYAKKAQDEADELAQIDFDGWVKSETIRRSAEFAKLPIAEQEAQSANFRDSFANDAKEYAANLNFSSRRRQVVDRLIPAHADQFGARLYAESIRQMERNNCEQRVNLFKASMDNADPVATGTNFDKLVEMGINPGMTRDQAISRACMNRAAGTLTALSAPELDERVGLYEEMLKSDRSSFDTGDGHHISRGDLTRLLNLAKAEQHRVFDRGYEEAQQLRATGELTPGKVQELYDQKRIGPKLYNKLTGELKTETGIAQRAAYEEFVDYLADRIAADDDETERDLHMLRDDLDRRVTAGEINKTQANSIQRKIDTAIRTRDKEQAGREAKAETARINLTKANRANLMDKIETHIKTQSFFEAAGGEFDSARLEMERAIKESPNLTGKEQRKLIEIIRKTGDAEKLFNTAEGKIVYDWLDEHIEKGSVKGLYLENGWGPDIEDQGLQRKAFNELRVIAQNMLYLKKDPEVIISKLEEHKKKLIDDKISADIAAAIVRVHGLDQDYSRIPSLFDAEPKPDADAPAAKTLSEMLTDLGKEENGGKGEPQQEKK